MGVESETSARGRRVGRNPEGAKRVEGRVSSYNHTNVAATPCGSSEYARRSCPGRPKRSLCCPRYVAARYCNAARGPTRGAPWSRVQNGVQASAHSAPNRARCSAARGARGPASRAAHRCATRVAVVLSARSHPARTLSSVLTSWSHSVRSFDHGLISWGHLGRGWGDSFGRGSGGGGAKGAALAFRVALKPLRPFGPPSPWGRKGVSLGSESTTGKHT